MTDTPLRIALIAIGSTINELPHFQLVWQTIDSIHDCHLLHKGERLGRDFYQYDIMATRFSTTFALTDFAGVLIRVMEVEPVLFEERLRSAVVALGKLCTFADEREGWEKVWK